MTLSSFLLFVLGAIVGALALTIIAFFIGIVRFKA